MLDTALGDEYARFVVLAGQYRAYYNMSCEDASWADTVAYLSAPENDPNNAGRPWTFQTCNEFGYFQTTDSEVCCATHKRKAKPNSINICVCIVCRASRSTHGPLWIFPSIWSSVSPPLMDGLSIPRLATITT